MRITQLFGTLFCFLAAAASVSGQRFLVRHAPILNGRLEGSVQQLMGESTAMNSGAEITGDWYVPGTPAIRVNGSPAFGGTLDGSGSVNPSGYTLTLNSGAKLRKLIRRTDASALGIVAAPPPPIGTRTVSLNNANQSAGTFGTLKNLTLNSGVGMVVVPPGSYGTFTVNTGSGLILGVAGSGVPAVYSFQSILLNSGSNFQVVGPVIVTVGNGISANSGLGNPLHPAWLDLRISSGGLTMNGSTAVYADVRAPSGTLTVNSGARFVGTAEVDRLVLNSGGILRMEPAPSVNHAPTVVLASPASGTKVTAPAVFELVAEANDVDANLAKIEFYQNGSKIGEDGVPPYRLSTAALGSGAYEFRATAIDQLGLSANSLVVALEVLAPNRPPVIVLTSPVDGSVFNATAEVSLAATASDPDGVVAKVEFYLDGVKISEDTAAPYASAVSGLEQGTYQISARAIDANGLSSVVVTKSVSVLPRDLPPVVAIKAPLDGAILTVPARVSLLAEASDDGVVSKVEFFNGTQVLGDDVVAPFEYLWTTAVAGTYTITARATDNSGHQSTSSPVRLTVAEDRLPFLANFEASFGYQSGKLDGQNAWLASREASVELLPPRSGQVLLLRASTPAALATRGFSSGDPRVTFVDFFVRPSVAQSAEEGVFIETNTSRVAFTRLGSHGILKLFDGPATEGNWFVSAGKVLVDANGLSADWLRITLRADYARKRWDAYLNGRIIAVDLGFADETQVSLTDLSLRGQPSSLTAYDDFLVGFDNPLFVDFDHDGIDDAWELAHGLNPAAEDRDGDADADGLSNIQEYLLGTDPSAADTDGDGLKDQQEVTLGTNPTKQDSDDDGAPDGWEFSHGLNPNLPSDAEADSDGDGKTNVQEYGAGTDPNDFFNGEAAVITIVTGNGQRGETGKFNEQPLVVKITDSSGVALSNAPVDFEVLAGGGYLAFANTAEASLETALTRRADSIGNAAIYFKQPPGVYVKSTISARVGGRSVVFESVSLAPKTATDTDGNGLPDEWERQYFSGIGVDPSSDNDGDGRTILQELQEGTSPIDYYNGVLPTILSLEDGGGHLSSEGAISLSVEDALGHPMVNAPVVFTAKSGGHLLAATPGGAGSLSVEVRSNAQGVARAYVVPVP